MYDWSRAFTFNGYIQWWMDRSVQLSQRYSTEMHVRLMRK